MTQLWTLDTRFCFPHLMLLITFFFISCISSLQFVCEARILAVPCSHEMTGMKTKAVSYEAWKGKTGGSWEIDGIMESLYQL